MQENTIDQDTAKLIEEFLDLLFVASGGTLPKEDLPEEESEFPDTSPPEQEGKPKGKNLSFAKYQANAKKTALPTATLGYLITGISGEVGELSSIFAKAARDQDGGLTQENIDNVAKELGDILWFVAMIAERFDLKLGTIARNNLKKLASRKARGTIQGSGDNR